jgi:dihydropteroate synthase
MQNDTPTSANDLSTTMKAPIWQCGRYALELSRPYVMGILNMTPDSFSDGGQYLDPQLAIDRAHQMIAEGADIIDIGGESTRPNAPKVCTCDELRRILPAIEALIDCGVPLSIDTQKPYVMREVLSLGVDIINDINGFNSPVAIDAVADSNAGLCIMHMQGTPQNMQADPHYADVVAEVAQFLGKQVQRLITAGVARERLCLDPGFGFGKTLAHNQTLMRHLPQLTGKHTLPLLVGVSRKRMIGTITGRESAADRVSGSVAAALWALQHGAHIVRVHDVAQTVDAIRTWQFFESA